MKLNLKSFTATKNEESTNNTSPKPKIVIIDDEAPNLFGLNQNLKDDYEVVSFESSPEALKYLLENRKEPIAAIISDHIMPELTGVELFTKLREVGHKAPRILITGFAGLDNVISAVNQAGIFSYLQKPVSSSVIQDTVKIAVKQFEVEREKQHLLNQLEKLIYSHQVQRIKQHEPLEKTMPLGPEDACIISFDIQKSSILGHDANHEFMENVIRNCYKMMIAYYDTSLLQANAYMIKELGDGFLCSVGFPFKCQGGIAENGYALAVTFADIFRGLVSRYFEDDNVFCSMGLSFGKVTGYFPKVGLKNYDLFGDSIVLATRYENFRKHLYESGVPEGNIIIMQTKLYKMLSQESQSKFTQFKLGDYKVREEADVTDLYYMILDD